MLLSAALHWINLFIGYLLMLAVMTYNVGYFFVIVSGLALGNLIFFHTKARLFTSDRSASREANSYGCIHACATGLPGCGKLELLLALGQT